MMGRRPISRLNTTPYHFLTTISKNLALNADVDENTASVTAKSKLVGRNLSEFVTNDTTVQATTDSRFVMEVHIYRSASFSRPWEHDAILGEETNRSTACHQICERPPLKRGCYSAVQREQVAVERECQVTESPTCKRRVKVNGSESSSPICRLLSARSERQATDPRRHSANLNERTRMQRINRAMDDLRGCLPTHIDDCSSRLSKIRTLRLATSYIVTLTRMLHGDDYHRVSDSHFTHAPPLSSALHRNVMVSTDAWTGRPGNQTSVSEFIK